MLDPQYIPTKLNIGCGDSHLEGYLNLDAEEKVKPDVLCNIKKDIIPFPGDHFEEILMIHSLEHVEINRWNHVFYEIRRVLKEGGRLVLAYPEFEKCAKNFIENFQNRREFFRWTLYGRQLYPGDYHVVPMRTEEVCEYLAMFGFTEVRTCPEPEEEWNTFLTCKKGPPPLTKADVLRTECFAGKARV